MDSLLIQFENVFAAYPHFYWYLAGAVLILVLLLSFIVHKSKGSDFLAEVAKLKNLSDKQNEIIKQKQELEGKVSEQNAIIADLERKLARLEHKD